MTLHKFDFETIHLQVLHLALDLLIEMDKMPDVSHKLTVEHRGAAEKLYAVLDIAIAMDGINLDLPADEHANVIDFIKKWKPHGK